ncbi:hypothetical protein G6O67_006996 [Ophiocordyceps sinensis]|uniref:Calcineurin-like phosphoesterase domain-containing protein n=2 Tax=Ophiocordyceps sinensis TaxID=72228 RepID=A0A8H4PHW6_9HYPO|nr:ser/Thr protein phosphatase family protein [Ophiocordyceps sinensis CO18]KAF4504997.1 hypothetical protein G6O67_006996 [Ophiocordyceps sinensis]
MKTNVHTRSQVRVKTRLLILSDTHGQTIDTTPLNGNGIDVVIHCGDLTEHSRPAEFQTTLRLLQSLDAPLKLVIAGNHDFTLDPPVFQRKIAECERIYGEALDNDLVQREFGSPGESLRLLQQQAAHGIDFLHEGTHTFTLANGARLQVYASPYTPADKASGGDDAWAFQYAGSHRFDIAAGTDVVMTHGLPYGVMDMTADRKRIGCPDLFAAVARAQPKLHCFGHCHNGWGAKLVAWRPQISDTPSHFSDIDNGRSRLIASLASVKRAADAGEEDQYAGAAFRTASYCGGDDGDEGGLVGHDGRTMMVNAALMAGDGLTQQPWVVHVDLAMA